MIQLGTDSFESQNIYTAAKVFELTLALPATPAEHNVKIRIELTGLAADQDRRLHVLVTNEAQDHWLGNFYCDLYNAAADQYAHVFLGSFVVDASEGLSVLIESDNSGDTSVDAEAILLSDDLEYYLTALQQDIARGIHGRPTWYVTKQGNDTTGDGTSWDTAYLTLAKAITEKSAGDLIRLGPGEFNESATTINLADCTVIGTGKGHTKLIVALLSLAEDKAGELRDLELVSAAEVEPAGTLRLRRVNYSSCTNGDDTLIVKSTGSLHAVECDFGDSAGDCLLVQGYAYLQDCRCNTSAVTLDLQVNGLGAKAVAVNCRFAQRLEASGSSPNHGTLVLYNCDAPTGFRQLEDGVVIVDGGTYYGTSSGTIIPFSAAGVWGYVLHNITNTQHAGHYLRTIDAVCSGPTNTDTTNEIAFHERQGNTEIARVTYGTVDGSRNSLTLS